MKAVLIALGLMVGASSSAKANAQSAPATYAVEFVKCSEPNSSVCAVVYGQGAPTEMIVRPATQGIGDQILSLMGRYGRSLAMNVNGRVIKVNKVMGGSYFAIEILDLEGDANAPRPRGL